MLHNLLRLPSQQRVQQQLPLKNKLQRSLKTKQLHLLLTPTTLSSKFGMTSKSMAINK